MKSKYCFERMQRIWQEGGNIFEAPSDNLISSFCKAEKLILYGCVVDGGGKVKIEEEEMVGRLIALSKGVVVLDAIEENLPLCGLIKTSTSNKKFSLFYLQPFSSFVSLNIYSSSFPGWGEAIGAAGCPAWIKFEMGARHCEYYSRLGIEEERWKIMKNWLDKWLI